MILLSTLINQFESAFFNQYKSQLLPSHKKALMRMKFCRTQFSPQMLVWGKCVKEELEAKYSSKVDIVQYRETMNPFLKKRIEQEALYA